MDIIEFLHYALCEKDYIKENAEYWKLIDELDALTKDMEGEQLEFINKLAFLESGVTAEASSQHFKEGFIRGFKLALEILER